MVTLKKIHKEWETDCQVDYDDPSKSSIEGLKLHHKYITYRDEICELILEAEEEFARVKIELITYFDGRMSKQDMQDRGWDFDPYKGATKPPKNERMLHIEAHPDYQRTKKAVELLKIMEKTVENILTTLMWRHQTVKNIIDYRKMVTGL